MAALTVPYASLAEWGGGQCCGLDQAGLQYQVMPRL